MRIENKFSDAQTSVDFLIGVSIFAVTLLFVLQVASTSVVNVAPESQTEEAVAERAGTVVYQDYAEGDGDVLEQNYTSIKSELVPSGEYDINVTVRNARTGDVTNSTGPEGEIPSGASSRVAGARRVVNAVGNTSVVEVRAWRGDAKTGPGV